MAQPTEISFPYYFTNPNSEFWIATSKFRNDFWSHMEMKSEPSYKRHDIPPTFIDLGQLEMLLLSSKAGSFIRAEKYQSKYSEIPLLRPPKLRHIFYLKTLFAKFKLFFLHFLHPVHLWL